MRRSKTVSSSNMADLPESSFWQRNEDEPKRFIGKEKEVHFFASGEGSRYSFNRDFSETSAFGSEQRPSTSSTRSASPDSRRSSTPGWLQRGQKDLRLFKLQKKVAKEQKDAEENARASGSERQPSRRPTFIDFTRSESDRHKQDHSSDGATAKPPLPTSQGLKNSPQNSLSSTPSRKPVMNLPSIPAQSFHEPDYTKTPKMELAQFLKAFTPGRSPRARTPSREVGHEPIDYLNVKPPRGTFSDDASNNSAGTTSKERSSWVNRLSMHRKRSSSPSQSKFLPQTQCSDDDNNDDDENSESNDTMTHRKSERPQLKNRFMSNAFFGSNNPITSKGATDNGPINDAATKPPGLIPTVTVPGITKASHYLPSEARRVNTPPIHTAGGKLKGYFWNFTDPSPEENKDSSPSDSFQQPFPMPFDAEGSDRQRRSIAPGVEKDWYRVRLDEILDGDELDDQLMKQELSAMEWSIPEHLTGSPLCPLHPKYKGKANGICVYHGRKSANVEQRKET